MKRNILQGPSKGLFSALFIVAACSLIPAGRSGAMLRRGNPTPLNPRYEFYIVDSDDNSPFAPTYNFVDTSYGSWLRVTGWSNTDNASDTIPITYDSIAFPYILQNIWVLQPAHVEPGPLGVDSIRGCSIDR